MQLQGITDVSAAVAAASARKAKVGLLAECLRALDPEETAVAVPFLSGALRQRQIGVGWASLQEPPEPAGSPTLSVLEVDQVFEQIADASGAGSQAGRRQLLTGLLSRATRPEQAFLHRLLTGELRQGALDGVMAEAIAQAAQVPAADVRRALMMSGSLGLVAGIALAEGSAGLGRVGLEVGRPVQPMLAGTAADVASALAGSGGEAVAVDWKIDGIRVQIHRSGDDVSVFTRTLDDITGRLPEVVEAARALTVSSAVLDAEAIALREDGRPHPFQVTASRTGSSKDTERLRADLPLTAFVFDVLHLDGEDLMDRPGHERAAILEATVPAELIVPRIVTDDAAVADAFFRKAIAAGHEGVVVKSLAAPYAAGRRGSGWVKVKPRHTLDLVVLAVEWGHGRRHGRLSNLHLGARDPESGGFVMLGKTFKGMTDEMLAWQTERLLELETSRDDWTVHVRPELVVETAFDGVQRSTRYPGGVTLRFARVLRYREDKTADSADTIDAVRAFMD
jgi:DNA ligase 1